MTTDVLPDDDVLAVAAQRRDRPEAQALLHALAELHATGCRCPGGSGSPTPAPPGRLARTPSSGAVLARVLPWRVGDVSGAGLGVAGTAARRAAVRLAGDDGWC
ncbi:hypothetical protein V2I01_30670 [Micromonospora sp. BRA006-A]|nr:hypothetical protein [Micromonospora sp. BRA006-A]